METANNLMDDLRAVIADAEELLRATADQAGPRVQEARERLGGAGRQLDAQVHEHPWAAVGIAAGLGLIAGILLSRK